MREEIKLSWDDVKKTVISKWAPYSKLLLKSKRDNRLLIWGVPRGGEHIAKILLDEGLAIVSKELNDDVDVIVDDIVDSGKTQDYYEGTNATNGYFWAPYKSEGVWHIFPWEEAQKSEAERLITRIIQHIGDDPERPGLKETPQRVVKSWEELFSGYKGAAVDYLKLFKSTSRDLIICKDIEFYSMCEHHMLPFFGKIHIGYIPDGYVIGLSKLARIADHFSRTLKTQENLTDNVATFLEYNITDNKGVGVIIEAKHLCMCGRGVNKQHSTMTTSAMLGSFRSAELRQEFLHLIK